MLWRERDAPAKQVGGKTSLRWRKAWGAWESKEAQCGWITMDKTENRKDKVGERGLSQFMPNFWGPKNKRIVYQLKCKLLLGFTWRRWHGMVYITLSLFFWRKKCLKRNKSEQKASRKAGGLDQGGGGEHGKKTVSSGCVSTSNYE